MSKKDTPVYDFVQKFYEIKDEYPLCKKTTSGLDAEQ